MTKRKRTRKRKPLKMALNELKGTMKIKLCTNEGAKKKFNTESNIFAMSSPSGVIDLMPLTYH